GRTIAVGPDGNVAQPNISRATPATSSVDRMLLGPRGHPYPRFRTRRDFRIVVPRARTVVPLPLSRWGRLRCRVLPLDVDGRILRDGWRVVGIVRRWIPVVGIRGTPPESRADSYADYDVAVSMSAPGEGWRYHEQRYCYREEQGQRQFPH